MWKCAGCHEEVEDTFNVCWNCGTSHDGVADPDFRSQAPEPTHQLTAPPAKLECSRCRSGKIIPAAEIMDSNQQYGSSGVKIKVDRTPEALIFRGAQLVDLRAKVCGECGHVELFVNQPDILWSAYKEQR